MDRDFLKSLGIEDAETVYAIMKSYGESINPLKQEKESLETEVDSYKGQISERDKQLEDLKDKVDSEEDLKETIEALKTANKEKDDERQKLLNDQKLDYELKIALNESGARNERAVKALLDLDTVKINEDGQLTGLKEQLDNLKDSDDYLFSGSQPIDDDRQSSVNYNGGSDSKGNNGRELEGAALGKSEAERLFRTNNKEEE